MTPETLDDSFEPDPLFVEYAEEWLREGGNKKELGEDLKGQGLSGKEAARTIVVARRNIRRQDRKERREKKLEDRGRGY